MSNSDHEQLPVPALAPGPSSGELPPRLVEVLVPLLEQFVKLVSQVVAPTLTHVAEQMRQTLTPAVEQVRLSMAPANEWLKVNGPVLIEFALAAKRATAEVAFANWDELDTEEEWLAALRLVRADDGVPLAWVPPGVVVKALVAAADHEARDDVLLAHTPEIIEHARSVLIAVQHPDLQTLRLGMEQGWHALEQGLHMPAQAAASSAVAEILRQCGHGYFRPFRREWEPARQSDPIAFGLNDLRLTTVMVAMCTAVQDDRETRTLRGFNRHSTAHGMRPEHYSEVNALRGLMLVTSAARELQFVLADEWMQPRSGPIPAIRFGRMAAAPPIAFDVSD